MAGPRFESKLLDSRARVPSHCAVMLMNKVFLPERDTGGGEDYKRFQGGGDS